MNSAMLVSLGMGLLPSYLITILVYTVIIKVLERGLTFVQSLMVSAVASAASLTLLVVYYIAKAPFDLNRDFDKLAALVAWCLLATLITRLARNYGFKKLGWFGLGAKANLWLLVLLWALLAVIFRVQYLTAR
jgi:hypothetical protein